MAGLEPTISESKSGVLPLHYIPMAGRKRPHGLRPRASFMWGGIWGSNPRHPEPQSGALPTELIPPNRPRARFARSVARQEGFEPPTYCLEGSCSILLSYWRIDKTLPAQLPVVPNQSTAGRTSSDVGAGDGKERVMGIEPTYPAWKAGVLPLNYTRRGALSTFSHRIISYAARECQHFCSEFPHPDL